MNILRQTVRYILLLLLLATSARGQECPERHWADSVMKTLDLDHRIGQLLMVAAYSNQGKGYEDGLAATVRKHHIGGVIFFQGDAVRQGRLTGRLQDVAGVPLLIGMDAEHGLGWRLRDGMKFPLMCTVGAVRDDSLVRCLGAAIARDCNRLGVHVNFAPVADINSNPANPIIGMRSFGEDPATVTRKAVSYAEGSLSRQVLPVMKHFPGHGDTDQDSHKTLPVIRHGRSRLDSVELYPYRAVTAAGLPAVMVSHLSVPALDPSGTPSSLSERIVKGVLREEIGFRGLCMTDAMNMKGVMETADPGEAEVRALLAGNDLLLFPEDPARAVEAVRKAVAEGRISEGEIDSRCRKVLEMKYRFVLPHLRPEEGGTHRDSLDGPEARNLKFNLYRSALTLIRNRDSLLPLKRLDTLRIATVNFGSDRTSTFQDRASDYAPTGRFVLKRGLDAENLRAWQKRLKDYNCLIIYNNRARNSAGKDFGHDRDLERFISAFPGKRLILIHPAIPYGLAGYPLEDLDAVLISYEKGSMPEDCAAQAVFGGCAVRGALPVSINAGYRAGTGICTPKTRLGYSLPEDCGMDSRILERIDSLCQAAISCRATPGCQVLAARNGQVVYDKAFGHHTYAGGRANRRDDIYDLASVTKVTATLPAVMKLVDGGSMELDQPLSRYFSTLDTTDKKDITLRQVLCHNAGLKASYHFINGALDRTSIPGRLFSSRKSSVHSVRVDTRLYANPRFRYRDSTISDRPKEGYRFVAPGFYVFPAYRDSVLRGILETPLSAEPHYVYSDLGFILLKYAVEETCGKSIGLFCKENFYRRLGMGSTDYRAAERLPGNRIVPSSHDRLYRKQVVCGYVHDPLANMLGGIAGHAGLFSTAGDLAKLLQMYLDGGTYGGERYLSRKILQEFTARNGQYPRNRRGLGFDKPEPDPHKPSPACSCAPLCSYGHTGFTGTLVWCDPATGLVYVFLSNRTFPDAYNHELTRQDFRTKIQETLYRSMKDGPFAPDGQKKSGPEEIRQ